MRTQKASKLSLVQNLGKHDKNLNFYWVLLVENYEKDWNIVKELLHTLNIN